MNKISNKYNSSKTNRSYYPGASGLSSAYKTRQFLCFAGSGISPFTMLHIGLPDYPPQSSLSNRAISLSSIGNILSPNEDDRGSWQGAFRHALWQADIASSYSEDIAKKIGDCHEAGYNSDLNRRIFSNLDDADSTVDNLNNIIGRKLGAEKAGRKTKEQALRILDFARTEGLYRVKSTPSGFYKVVREVLNEDKYIRLRKEILLRNNDGL